MDKETQLGDNILAYQKNPWPHKSAYLANLFATSAQSILDYIGSFFNSWDAYK
jgi:hypothetical protein